MHTYETTVSLSQKPSSPPIGSFRFRCAEDVVRFAQHNPSMGATTWPETWHLDEDGLLCCYHRGSTIDSIRSLADDPSELREVRAIGSLQDGRSD